MVLIKIAQADGKISPEEQILLQEIGSQHSLPQLISQANAVNLDTLLSQLTLPADRFFVRLRAQLMAESDGIIDATEHAILDALLEHLPLPEHLEHLLDLALNQELDGDDTLPMEQVEALYIESSFHS